MCSEALICPDRDEKPKIESLRHEHNTQRYSFGREDDQASVARRRCEGTALRGQCLRTGVEPCSTRLEGEIRVTLGCGLRTADSSKTSKAMLFTVAVGKISTDVLIP